MKVTIGFDILVLLHALLRFSSADDDRKLVVVLLDGFRRDYLEDESFKEILSYSIVPKWIEPVFPPVSFPNWHSLSTGVYPETHGILNNEFYDYDRNEWFMIDSNVTRELHWWQNSEPFWITATRQKKKVSLYGWSRCDVPYDSITPSKCSGYLNVRDPDFEILRSNFESGLKDLKEGYDVVMIYGIQTDNDGHSYGPKSEEVTRGLKLTAGIFKDFRTEMKNNGFFENVNVVAFADHGMIPYSPQTHQYRRIGDYIDVGDVRYVAGVAGYCSIITKEGKTDKVLEDLKAMEGVTAYKRSDIPQRFHWKDNVNTPDILLIADKGILIEGLVNSSLQVPPQTEYLESQSEVRGTHSILPELDSNLMGAMFAWGPDFSVGSRDEAVEAVDMYGLLCSLIDVDAAPNNGSWSRVAPLLKSSSPTLAPSTFLVSIALAFITYIYETK